jgi:hypothetical protein
LRYLLVSGASHIDISGMVDTGATFSYWQFFIYIIQLLFKPIT